MKFRQSFLLLILLLFSIFATVPKANAQDVDYVAAAIAALQTSNVYVHPGTPGTDFDTYNTLNQVLRAQDNVVLVMLPSEALVGTDMFAIVKEISNGIGNTKTIGLSVGEEVFGYSQLLPEGVAFDLMERADDVTSDPAGTLITFSQNVHLWLSRNEVPTSTPTPEPTPTPHPTAQPVVLPKVGDLPLPLRVILLVIFLIVVLLLANPIIKAAKRSKRRGHLDSMRPTIEGIQLNVSNIGEMKIRRDLEGACKAALGLLNSFLKSNEPVGDQEKYFPMLLVFMDMQIRAIIDHESQLRPLDTEQLIQLKYLLVNYDSLFVRLQQNDPDAIKLMTSMVKANKIMAESLGYQTN